MKAIMVMFDTLSRRFLSTYGNTWVKTPNFERLQAHCVQFDEFYAGSLPCMPARRELHTGRYNFLHRSWGPLEPFDDSVVECLKEHNIYTHIVSDHNHYWEDGGATYVTRYNSWEGFRGQEGDHWVGIVDKDKLAIPKQIKTGRSGPLLEDCYANRTRMSSEEDFSSVQTIQAGIRFIEENIESDDWFLQIECFDPHEPFHVPQRFLDLYEEIPQVPYFDWPSYAPVCESEEEKRQVIIRYASLISMCDEYLGNVLDSMDHHKMWDDTMLIVNTDHGFLMGEHNWWGKSTQPVYQEIAHIPFYLHLPNCSRKQTQQLAQTIDIAPTLLEFFGIEKPKDMLGNSMISVVEKDESIHDAILFGYFGGHINVYDGTYVYMRSSIDFNNAPLYEYTLMPTRMKGFMESKELENTSLCNEFGFLKNMNVLKIPSNKFLSTYYYGNKLFNIKHDYEQRHNLEDLDIECQMVEKMRLLFLENEAPMEQYKRMGLSKDYAMKKKQLLIQKREREKKDAIHLSIDVTKKQVAKFQYIKTLLPSQAFDYVTLQIELGVFEGMNVDEAITLYVKQAMTKANLPEIHQELFMRLLNYAYEIK